MAHAAIQALTTRLAAALAVILAAWPAAAATRWTTDADASHLTFSATQAGARFSGRFARFDAHIVFDGQDTAGSRLEVRIATASADTHDGQRDSLLHGPQFFWSDAHPQAVFLADRFAATDAGWTAAGSLTLRGVTRPVLLRFTFSPLPGGDARLAGSATIRRLDFGVGQGEWSDTKWVGDPVEVAFDLLLRPAAAATGP